MTVEAATYIDSLNPSYPASGDSAVEGDDHIRLIKSVLKTNTFPNITGQVTSSHTELNLLDGLTSAPLTGVTSGQWTLMNSTSISGNPTQVAFVNGSGGVVISDLYDEYLIVCDNVYLTSTTASLRLQVSINAGSSYTAGTFHSVSQYTFGTTPTAGADDLQSANYVPLEGNGLTRNSSSASLTTNMLIRINRPAGSAYKCLGAAEYSIRTDSGATTGYMQGGKTYFHGDTASALFDAIRVYPSASTFANNGTVKLFGRRV